MFTLNCKGRLLLIDDPIVMGIINVTPDSFYEDSRKTNIADILEKAGQMINEGASILDIGGQSSRPGSEPISADEERRRVNGAIEAIHRNFPEVIISVDTYRSVVALDAIAAGASIVNDISAGKLDTEIINHVARMQVPYVCMHMKGTPATMQQEAVYEDITREVLDFFINTINLCTAAGINDIIIDPGFGFAKTSSDNFLLLKQMEVLKITGKPILAGLSRKSTIYKTLGVDPSDALNGTTVMNTLALTRGASILRVHDVKEAVEAIKLFTSYRDA